MVASQGYPAVTSSDKIAHRMYTPHFSSGNRYHYSMWTRAITILLLLSLHSGSAQITKPIAHDSAIEDENNRFLQRKPELDLRERTRQEDEEIIESMEHCYADVHLKWMTQVSSSIYATPIIVDLFSDNKKEILIPSHVHYLEVLEAEDGATADGWPAYHKSHLHGSPFVFDIDRDGILDIGIATFNGEIQFYKDTVGKKLPIEEYAHFVTVGREDDAFDVISAVESEERLDEILKKTEEKITTRRLLNDEQTVEQNGEHLTDAATDSFKVFDENDEDDGDYADINFNSRRRGGFFDEQDIDNEIYSDLDANYENGDDWDNDIESDFNAHVDTDYVYLDGHVLSSPVIADLDGDGIEELIVAVSYFFDTDFYSTSDHDLLPKGVDIRNYLSGGIVVFDLTHRYARWSTHLDLSTTNVSYPAYVTTSPSVLDIDGDGRLEIVVCSQVGFIYVLDSEGKTRANWPKQMGSILTRPLVDDLNGDGKVEIVSADNLGNIAMFDIDGKVIWERHVKSAILSSPTAGDVTGDGELDIVFGTASGHVYVLDAISGQDRDPFPSRVHGGIFSPISITKLRESPGQHLVFTAFDGFLYIIQGESGCIDARDIGEDSYSMVLVDDVTDNGKLDLVVTTMNGNILLFETDASYHPLRVWQGFTRGTESAIARTGHVGVFASKDSRRGRDIRGEKFTVRFSIVDTRFNDKSPSKGKYNVTIVLKNVGVNEMNMGPSPVIGVMDVYSQPGTYELTLPCPRTRTTALVQVLVKDQFRHEFKDEFALSFHMHWYKFIKFLIAVPFTVMAMIAVFIKPHLMTLPS